jgi:hypothetical protein
MAVINMLAILSATMVTLAQSVERWATGWTAGVRFLAEEKDFPLLSSVQISSGAHPASYSMGIKHRNTFIFTLRLVWLRQLLWLYNRTGYEFLVFRML